MSTIVDSALGEDSDPDPASQHVITIDGSVVELVGLPPFELGDITFHHLMLVSRNGRMQPDFPRSLRSRLGLEDADGGKVPIDEMRASNSERVCQVIISSARSSGAEIVVFN